MEWGCGINSKISHTIDSDTTFKTILSQVQTSCEQTNKETGHNLLKTNIVGIKGGAGSRKRKAAIYSGGWSRWRGPPPGSRSRFPWCTGRRRLSDQDNQVGISSIVSRINGDKQDGIPVEKSRNQDVASLQERLKNNVSLVLEGAMGIKQKNELPAITENIAVLCQTDVNSDKDTIILSDYWAQDFVVSGAGGQQDDQHHHEGSGELESSEEPGHIVHDVSGHVMDKPGKDKTLNHSNFSVSGQVEQGPEAEQQEDGGRAGGPCDEGGDDGLPEGQHDAHLHPANQGDQQCGGGQAEHGVGEQGEAQPHGVHEGGGGGGYQPQQVRSREASGGQVALG